MDSPHLPLVAHDGMAEVEYGNLWMLAQAVYAYFDGDKNDAQHPATTLKTAGYHTGVMTSEEFKELIQEHAHLTVEQFFSTAGDLPNQSIWLGTAFDQPWFSPNLRSLLEVLRVNHPDAGVGVTKGEALELTEAVLDAKAEPRAGYDAYTWANDQCFVLALFDPHPDWTNSRSERNARR